MTESTQQRCAFVAGATGFVGREIVRVLGEHNLETWAHVRPDSSALERWTVAFTTLGASVDKTPWDEEALTARLKALQPDVVFGCLGTTRKRASSEGMGASEAYENIDYGLTAMLLRAAIAADAERFVYISSAGMGTRKPSNAYMLARWRVEQDLKASGIAYTIARPSMIVGDRDQPRGMESFGAKLTDGALGAIGFLGAKKLRDRYRSTSNTILATSLVRSVLAPSSSAEVLESEQLRL